MNYGELKTWIGEFAKKRDFTASEYALFVDGARERIGRELRARWMLITDPAFAMTELETPAPTDCREILTLRNGRNRISIYTPKKWQEQKYARRVSYNRGAYACLDAGTILCDKTFAEPSELRYYKTPEPLSLDTDTNPLLTNERFAYLNPALHIAFGYLHNEERAQFYDNETDKIFQRINNEHRRVLTSRD